MACDRKAEEGHSSVSTESKFFITWPFSGRHLLIPELGQGIEAPGAADCWQNPAQQAQKRVEHEDKGGMCMHTCNTGTHMHTHIYTHVHEHIHSHIQQSILCAPSFFGLAYSDTASPGDPGPALVT